MEININTSLLTRPCPKEVLNYIQRGTTPTLTFDLNNKIYNFDDISQVEFILQQGNRPLVLYKMFTTSGAIDDHFSYDSLLNAINFTFSSEETLQFSPSKKHDRETYVKFQVVVKLDFNGQQRETIISDTENDIYVLDTLYSHTI